ncbi:unnamed protein product [Rotaria sp. Silwood2]|nr:unnamed protein product [Rotaria sp. Silwood2]
MALPVKLLSVRRTTEASTQNEFIWACETNGEWTPLPDAISVDIEKAFRRNFEEITIDELYRIDVKYFLIEQVNELNRKQRIRRQRRYLKSSVSRVETIEAEARRCERFSCSLVLVSRCSASVDTNYYGSPFIAEWYLTFTEGKRDVTFDSIFPVLLQGLREEGKSESERVVQDIVDTLNEARKKSLKIKEKKRMEVLEDYCAKLYTKACFVFRTVNDALRDNDRTKLKTLGPYCFLLYNYVGRHMNDDFPIRHRFQPTLRLTRSQSMTVYRGDYMSHELLEEYQQALQSYVAQNNVSVKRTEETTIEKKITYRCSKCRKHPQCDFQIKVIFNDNVEIIVPTSNKHNHDHRATTTRVPLPVRDIVRHAAIVDLSQCQTRRTIQNQYEGTVSRLQITCLLNYHRSIPDVYSVDDFRSCCYERSRLYSDIILAHKPFVAKYYINSCDDLFVFITTRKLISTAPL